MSYEPPAADWWRRGLAQRCAVYTDIRSSNPFSPWPLQISKAPPGILQGSAALGAAGLGNPHMLALPSPLPPTPKSPKATLAEAGAVVGSAAVAGSGAIASSKAIAPAQRVAPAQQPPKDAKARSDDMRKLFSNSADHRGEKGQEREEESDEKKKEEEE